MASMTAPTLPRQVNLKANIRQAEQHFGDILWFRRQVIDGGPWDLKHHYGPEYREAGNWHYGVMGAALGVPLQFLLNEAGVNQAEKDPVQPGQGRGKPGFRLFPYIGGEAPYGDYARSQELITRGYQYFWSHRRSIDIDRYKSGTFPRIPF